MTDTTTVSSQPLVGQTSNTYSLYPAPGVLQQAIAGLLFALLCIAYTWPLALAPDSSLSGLNDPPLFTWILNWVSQTVYTDPMAVFDGPVFHPYGRTITFSEPLLVPALTIGAPLKALGANPILTYNVTLVVFQAVSAWAAWLAVRRITGSQPGAIVAGVVYALSSYKMGYYNFINIHLSFALPLAVVCLIDFLEKQRWRDVLLVVTLVFLQVLSIWYGAIPLILVLLVLAACVLLLRPTLLTPRLVVRSGLGALLFVGLVAPIAWMYWQTSVEMNFSRSLAEVNKFRADVLSFLDPGVVNIWHRWIDVGREPGLFPGFVVIGLIAVLLVTSFSSTVWRGIRHRRWSQWIIILLLALIAAVFVLLIAELWPVALRQAPDTDATQSTRTSMYLIAIGVLALVAIIVRGLSVIVAQPVNTPTHQRSPKLGINEWAAIAGLLTLLGMLLTLGPVIHVNNTAVGQGLYGYLHAWFPGFSGLRIAIRLAFVFLFFAGVLAALMLARITKGGSRVIAPLVYLVPVLVIVELWPGAITYQQIDWDQPPPVYARLQALPDNHAVFELPTFDEDIDSMYMLWSIRHGKPLVNGVSGFYPPTLQPLAASAQSIPSRRDVGVLQAIDGLGYLIIHLDKIRRDDLREAWTKVSQESIPGLRFEGRYDDALLFELNDQASPAWRWRKQFAAHQVRAAKRLDMTVSHDVQFDSSTIPNYRLMINNRVLGAQTKNDQDKLSFRIPAYTKHVSPYHVELQQTYAVRVDENRDDRYRIGTSAWRSPCDIVAQSGSRQHGSVATAWVNGINHAMRQPGYNIVVLDSSDCGLVRRAVFDVSKKPQAGAELVQFLQRAPIGSIVVVVLKDRGVGALDDETLAALSLIGAGKIDPRLLADSSSHLVIGVRGEENGAVEQVGLALLESVVGVDRRDRAMRITDYQLRQ